jgi:excisionase family DNA binding protein
MTQRKRHRKTHRSHIGLTFEERAEVEVALEDLTLTRRLLRSAKGALTAKQLAEVLNISPKTIFKMAKAGRIPSFRVGTSVRFDPRLIVDWMRKQRTGHAT